MNVKHGVFRKDQELYPFQITPRELNLVYRKYRQLAEQEATGSNKTMVQLASIRTLRETWGSLMDACGEFEEVFQKSFAFPYLTVMVNAHGQFIYVCGDERSIQRASAEGIYLGGTAELTMRGVNPFSVAIELQRCIYMERSERLVETFREWDAYCYPIKGKKKKPDGYLGFLFPEYSPGPGAGPFLHAIAMKMEQQYADRQKQEQAEKQGGGYLEERLYHFDLTERERQVAAYWMLDYDYKQISRVLGISENTVRVVINRINGKLKVNSKASMILRVLDAI